MPRALTFTLLAASAAHAQCEPRWHAAPPGQGLTGTVSALTMHAGDLIAGGAITDAGGTPVNAIARWNGTAWSPLGTGVTGGEVHALMSWRADVIAGGTFTAAGGAPSTASIARWNGADWSSLGGGVNAPVTGLVAWGEDLVVAGSFTSAGGVAAARVARWNGTTWSPIGPGVPYEVLAVCVHEDTLYLGAIQMGMYPHVLAWNGLTWQPLPGLHHGFDGTWIQALTSYDGVLVVGGFNAAVQYRRAGTWTVLGLGGPWSATSMALHRGRLMVGAALLFTGLSFVTWDGATWSTPSTSPNYSVYALTRDADSVYAGGVFTEAGGAPSPGWARYGCACYADCDNSGGLSAADFGCFQTQFVGGHPYTDCNGDDQLTVADFGCFQTKFVTGCP